MSQPWTDMLSISKEMIELLERLYIVSINLFSKRENFSFSAPSNEEVSETETFDVLYKSGRLFTLLTKKTFCGLLSDFCLYMNLSLKQVFELKPQIAFTLARKPLIDNFFYLMYLYLHPENCIDKIFSSNPQDKDTNSQQNKSLDCLMCSELAHKNNYTEYPDVIYKLRRSTDDKSLLFYCDKSLHIATSRSKIYNTQSGELNFVFMDDNCIKDYTTCYLTVVPTLVAHSMRLCFDLFDKLFHETTELNNYATKLEARYTHIYENFAKITENNSQI